MFDERIGKYQSKGKITENRAVKSCCLFEDPIKRGAMELGAA